MLDTKTADTQLDKGHQVVLMAMEELCEGSHVGLTLEEISQLSNTSYYTVRTRLRDLVKLEMATQIAGKSASIRITAKGKRAARRYRRS